MKSNRDIVVEFPGLCLIHQKIPAREVGRHHHLEHEFFLPLQGEIRVENAGTSAKAGPGRMLYVPPHWEHSFSSSSQGSGERVIWLIHDNIWKKQVKTPFKACAFPMNHLVKELIFHLLIHPQTKGAAAFRTAMIETLKESLEAQQVRRQKLQLESLTGRAADPRIRLALDSLKNNLDSNDLAWVAEQCGMSTRNFNRLFLKETGMTPKEFLIQVRIENAKELLTDTNLTVTEISMQVGYNSLSKFIAAFKKAEGQLPSDFRSGLHTPRPATHGPVQSHGSSDQ